MNNKVLQKFFIKSIAIFLLAIFLFFNCLEPQAYEAEGVSCENDITETGSRQKETTTQFYQFKKAKPSEIDKIVQENIEKGFSYDLDKAQVTFVFDDALQDIDLVASIFEEYDYPLCLALIPENLSDICSGLTKDTGKYQKGMTVKAVAEQVTSQGGEVLSHGYTVLTNENINDSKVLKEIFFLNKQELMKNGFTVDGIILNGGAEALRGGSKAQGGYIMQYYASKYFYYSDQYGVTEQYYHPRISMNKPIKKCIDDINHAVSEKKWIVFVGHSITGIYGEKYSTEKHLRTLLQYCKDNEVEVVTYATVYNKYGKYRTQ